MYTQHVTTPQREKLILNCTVEEDMMMGVELGFPVLHVHSVDSVL